MEGMSNASAKDLVPLAKSWLQAPTAEPLADCGDAAYDPAQRAYVLRATGTSPSIQIPASAEHPIVNPCLVVHNWNTVDLDKLPKRQGDQFRRPFYLLINLATGG